MGNKNTGPPKGPDNATQPKEEDDMDVSGVSGSVPKYGTSSLSPELLASLQSLSENTDYTLLPNSLHQIAEFCSLQENYQLAIQLLQLEKLYHERVLSNLTDLQENWESRCKENADNCLPAEVDNISKKHIEALRHICETHLKPSLSEDITITVIQNKREVCHQGKVAVCNIEIKNEDDDDEVGKMKSKLGQVKQPKHEMYEETSDDMKDEEEEDDDMKVEWPTGVHQATDTELEKLSNADGNMSTDGLVSILKRRRASLDGLPPPSNADKKINAKRKVRFTEPEEHDEVGADSCLILLLLCLVTVVISAGGTALYCFLVDSSSHICVDFANNFYMTKMRSFFERLGLWLPRGTYKPS
ncbi:consortin, connexin sorting protein b [Corythoichthys intestinalis]|uniref:consortin, connexin sorting protein b n=1 Tax=Corythoichthys intestinalis TaxID=161448 RepID=UPI0025A60450|nr:consortin, connexin sorting protein b [Corythoichthys intestinalis]